jgi:hypothetical protein
MMDTAEMKARGTNQRPHLRRGKTFNEALGQTFRLEVMEQSWNFD